MFAGTGGVLWLNDTPDMAGTIYGFSPPDAIDLTDATYDPSATEQLDAADNLLTVAENSGSYNLQLDPAQVFLTNCRILWRVRMPGPAPGHLLASSG